MTPIEPVVLSFSSALLLGLGYGSGPCNIACLPYLGPVFAATDGGIRAAWRTLLPFSLGRVSGYALLGGLAGGFGLVVEDWLAAPWTRWLLGAATLLAGLSILLGRRRAACARACPSSSGHRVVVGDIGRETVSQRTSTLPGSLYLMGMGMALNPCAPLITLTLASATAASVAAGLSLGSGFALGAVLVPTLIFTFGAAHFGQQLRHHLARHRVALENTSVALLMSTGAATALGWITP
ncbi:MAG: sulfite exporter TauE/SafE family protein [Candidatus Thiodiazotropha sp.]